MNIEKTPGLMSANTTAETETTESLTSVDLSLTAVMPSSSPDRSSDADSFSSSPSSLSSEADTIVSTYDRIPSPPPSQAHKLSAMSLFQEVLDSSGKRGLRNLELAMDTCQFYLGNKVRAGVITRNDYETLLIDVKALIKAHIDGANTPCSSSSSSSTPHHSAQVRQRGRKDPFVPLSSSLFHHATSPSPSCSSTPQGPDAQASHDSPMAAHLHHFHSLPRTQRVAFLVSLPSEIRDNLICLVPLNEEQQIELVTQLSVATFVPQVDDEHYDPELEDALRLSLS